MTSPRTRLRVLVVIPTYNERENISTIVRRLRAAVPSAHVLVTDDASPDGTGRIAETMAAKDDQVHVLHRPGKGGLGAAYLAGFAWGRREGFDVLVEMDADGSHLPEQLPVLLERIDAGADIVLGSRWVAGGSVLNWPRHREALSRGGNLYTRLVLGLPLRDATGGFRCYRTTALDRLALHTVASQGYCFQVDLAWRAVREGLTVKEVPITFVERALGASKMNRTIILEALWRVTRWGVRARVDRLRAARRPRPAQERPWRETAPLVGESAPLVGESAPLVRPPTARRPASIDLREHQTEHQVEQLDRAAERTPR